MHINLIVFTKTALVALWGVGSLRLLIFGIDLEEGKEEDFLRCEYSPMLYLSTNLPINFHIP